MGVILYIIAEMLGFIAKPIKFLYHLFLEIKAELTLTNLKMIDNEFLAKAILQDKYCNHEDWVLLTALFITEKSTHKFGNPNETISSVLGKNLVAKTLTKKGYEICDILNGIQKDHVLISIDNTIF